MSQLGAGRDSSDFADMCRSADLRNPQRRIAGVLLFDGRRLLHWIHGPPEDVRQLMGAVVLDPRHTALSLRLEAMLPAQASSDTAWRTGLVDPEAMDVFAAAECPDARAVLDALGRLIEQAELATPPQVERT